MFCLQRPSGGLITSTLWRRDRHVVVFFEKNGLQKNNVNFELAAQQPNMKVKLVSLWIHHLCFNIHLYMIQRWCSLHLLTKLNELVAVNKGISASNICSKKTPVLTSYGLRGSDAPWFMCWFRHYFCLCACFLTYLLPHWFTSWLIYLRLPE